MFTTRCRLNYYPQETLHRLLSRASYGMSLWIFIKKGCSTHYSDGIMGAMASQITSVLIVHSSVCSDTDQRKHKKSASLASMKGIHQWPVVSLTKVLYRGKCFHLMTSSYVIGLLSNIMLWCSVMTHCWMIEIFGVRKYIYTLVKIIMETPLPKKPLCNWRLSFIEVVFSLKSTSITTTDMMIQNHFPLVEYQNELTTSNYERYHAYAQNICTNITYVRHISVI